MTTRLPINPHPPGPAPTYPTSLLSCLYCGHEFRSKRDWQKYGNHDCQQAYWKMLRDESARRAAEELTS